MRYSTVVLALAAAVSAQSASETVVQLPTPTGVDPASSSLAAKINECLADCDATDVTCQAKCVDVPAPNDDQANDNVECARECDQGDGSAEDTEAFGQCLLRCRDEHYFSLGNGTPNPTGSNNGSGNNDAENTTATGTAATEQTGSPSEEESGNESGSPSASASGAEESGDDDSAASALSAITSLSLFGLVAAFFL